MPVLRISDVPVETGRHRVEVAWQQDRAAPQVAASTFAYQVGRQDAEKIRWYLEDYAEFPARPAPALAIDAEARLAELGSGLFRQVFGSQGAARIWSQAQAQLSRVRVEVEAIGAEASGLPWELLRDPDTGAALALGAGEFVRAHRQTAGDARSPGAAGDQLRVLLVICRPGGRSDVPFRSVASRLVRSGVKEMEGLHLEVLRPATYAHLAEVLHEAAKAGGPYHIVHFDGHGTYLDATELLPEDGVSMTAPARPGQHGYLIFEDPHIPTNQQLVDGPTLGHLLATTRVPVLVLNACRSAYMEAPPHPGEPDSQPEDSDPSGSDLVTDDVHARIRAYGSLAAEAAEAGVPGVVAMRYNVYVVTAAQYMADLYAHLLSGKTLGWAATAARRALADNPDRHIGATPVALQDWAVPVVYETVPLTLLRLEQRQAPLIHLTPADSAEGGGTEVPRPDAGFFGRDETLLALDRAFDDQPVVLLHAFAGAGKTSTAAEFARWYAATGGLYQPHFGTGPVLWSSFEHYLPPARLLDTAADHFAPLLEANGIHWQAITDPAHRRHLVLQLLAQVPVLWVWDNIEPITGFPPGSPSAWTHDEQDQIIGFLRDLAQHTICKVLVTSRRDERTWLGELPARLRLPPMPMRERLQFAAALAARRGHHDLDTDWRPLLRYTAGNPLTITVLVGQALRDNLTTTHQLEGFVERLRSGEQELEAGEDTALGRSRSLTASLSYGFTHTFTETERAQLAVLHLFRDAVDAGALCCMGSPEIVGEDAVPQLAGLNRDTAIRLLDEAAAIGLLSPLGLFSAPGGDFYGIHPALPWFFTTMFATAIGSPGSLAAQQAARAYTHTLAELGGYYEHYDADGNDPMPGLGLEEANLHHALTLARHSRHWHDVLGCLKGLCLLYERTGRDGELARLVDQNTPDFTDPATDEALPGRESQWGHVTSYRVQFAIRARDWPTATRLQRLAVAQARGEAETALTIPTSQLTPAQRSQIRDLSISLQYLGHILRNRQDPGCQSCYLEAITVAQRIQDRLSEAVSASGLGNAFLDVPALRDLDQAQRWHQRSLDLTPINNWKERGRFFFSLAGVAHEQFDEARATHQPESVLLEHLNAAFSGFQQALDLFPDDDAEGRGAVHNNLGAIYSEVGNTQQALYHYQQCIRYEEPRGNIYRAGIARHNIARLLLADGRSGDALQYARAALLDFERTGPGAVQDAANARDLITELEQAAG